MYINIYIYINQEYYLLLFSIFLAISLNEICFLILLNIQKLIFISLVPFYLKFINIFFLFFQELYYYYFNYNTYP